MSAEIEAVIEGLASAPARVKEYLRLLDDRATEPFQDGWSAAEVFLHIRAADAIISPRVMHILVRDNPVLPSWDERRWGEIWHGAGLPLEKQLTHFALGREQLVSVLRPLTPEEWQRAGNHEKRGRQTIEDVVHGLVEHEEEHIEQMRVIVGTNQD